MMQVITDVDPNDRVVYRPGSGNTLEIFDIQVMSKRSCGIGSSLLSKLEAVAKLGAWHSVWALVRTENTAAIRFYQKNGYKSIGILSGFYAEGAACVMRKLI